MGTELLLIITFSLGLFTGWAICYSVLKSIVNDVIRRSGLSKEVLSNLYTDKDTEEPASDTVPVVLEQHRDCIYAYRADTNEFMAQGRDKQELISNIENRYKKNFVMQIKQGSELIN